MKSSELNITKEYGVVPSWSYSNRRARDPLLCTRSAVLKTRIVSMDKYQYSVWRTTDEFATSFTKTSATKGFGYKVESNGTFWIARPQDIIALWDVLEARWTVEEAQQKAVQEEIDRRHAIEQAQAEEATKYADEAKARIKTNIESILRRTIPGLSVYTTHDRGAWSSTVTMNLKTLDALVERVLDLVEV